jgi:aminoglycoside/choline kinase family phosphotransferase
MRIDKKDLLQFVKQAFPQRIIDLSVEKLGGDASDRNYYRLHVQGQGNDLPKTMVVMELQEPFPSGELPFINILHTLEESGLGVPRLYAAQSQLGLVLLEDLGDEILQKEVQGDQPDVIRSLYHEAIDIIVRMQFDLEASSGCVAFRTAFTVEKFIWELDFFRTHYIERLLQKKIDLRDRQSMDHLFFWLSSLMDGEEKVFTHRDYHSRNLVCHEGKLKILDFQDARLGLAQYDVVSLLRDSYVVLEDTLRESLIEYYLSQWEARTRKRIDRSRFRYVFDMTSLQRNLKAVGTFAYQAVERKNPRYLKYIPDTLRYVHENLFRYDELSPYQETLARYLPFERA